MRTFKKYENKRLQKGAPAVIPLFKFQSELWLWEYLVDGSLYPPKELSDSSKVQLADLKAEVGLMRSPPSNRDVQAIIEKLFFTDVVGAHIDSCLLRFWITLSGVRLGSSI